jgi:alpha-tubulin suppressor-like RCC1 family protein
VAGAIVFRSVDAGTLTACGVATDGTGYCWGENRVGELGDGTTTSSTVPVRVAGGLTFDRIRPARGNSTVLHTCGATSGGTLYCWGLNDKGQVGATTAATCTFSVTPVPCALSPSAVSGLGAVAAFDVGTSHSCALTTGAAVMCWGDNTQAELGDGTNVNHPTPVAVVGGLHFP